MPLTNHYLLIVHGLKFSMSIILIFYSRPSISLMVQSAKSRNDGSDVANTVLGIPATATYFLPCFFYSETVALRACHYRASESSYFQQESAKNILTVPPAPWYFIAKSWSYPINVSNVFHQPIFARYTWFEVCHANRTHPPQMPRHLIDGPLRQVQQWRILCG